MEFCEIQESWDFWSEMRFSHNKNKKKLIKGNCTTIHKYPIFSMRYFVLCKVYTEYHGTSEIQHGLWACTVDNPLAKARGLSLRTGAQTMLYLSLICFPRKSQMLSSFDKKAKKYGRNIPIQLTIS